MAIRMQMSISMATRLHHFQFQNSRGVRKANLLCGASSSFSSSSSLSTAHQNTELEAIKELSEIVPDTMIFDDFERFPPTAATVSSSLLLGICSLPETRFGSVIENAMVDSEGYASEEGSDRLSCIFNKAMVNVGAELAKVVPGRVSTEVDARLAYDTHGTIKKISQTMVGTWVPNKLGLTRHSFNHKKVHELLKLYEEVEVPQERLLFKIPATWQGIEASRLLEAEGIQTHVTFVYSFPQAAAAAQAGSSVIQIFVGRVRDWARNHSGDPEIESALSRGEDPGIALATKAFNYIHKHGHKSKLMAAAIRNKQDLFSLLGIDYIIVPLKILESLKDSKTLPDDKYSFIRRLSPNTAQAYNFTAEELVKWDQATFASAIGPAAEELLAAGLEGYINQSKRVEAYLTKIWPPPNV